MSQLKLEMNYYMDSQLVLIDVTKLNLQKMLIIVSNKFLALGKTVHTFLFCKGFLDGTFKQPEGSVCETFFQSSISGNLSVAH